MFAAMFVVVFAARFCCAYNATLTPSAIARITSAAVLKNRAISSSPVELSQRLWARLHASDDAGPDIISQRSDRRDTESRFGVEALPLRLSALFAFDEGHHH